MIKSELIQKLGQHFTDLPMRTLEKSLDTIFSEISQALGRGDRVELRGFGSFSVRYRDRRLGCNPRTGEKISIPGKSVPFFKTGKGLRDRLNEKF